MPLIRILPALLCLLVLLFSPAALPQEADVQDMQLRQFDRLSRSFFNWRQTQQPSMGDDIPRVERPQGWAPDFSPEALEAYRETYRAYLNSLDALDTDTWPIEKQVDARLLRAAVQRVHWELDILELPHRNPIFYVDQTLGSLFELLTLSSPVDERRIRELIIRLQKFPDTLRDARENLTKPVRPFAEATIAVLADVDERLSAVGEHLDPYVPKDLKKEFHRSVSKGISSLESFRKLLQRQLDEMQTAFAIGPDAYAWFLTHVALIPNTPNELLAQGQQAWSRSVAWGVLEQNRNRQLSALPLLKSTEQQIKVGEIREKEIRAFLETHDLMTVPDWLQHYLNRPMPDYLAPLSFMGVNDDLTSETRLDENAYSYVNEPSADLPYFSLSRAKDPRPMIIHEGVPGHYYQMALSWANPNPVRRRYIDSSINEGIAFYVEEMLLQAGLFDFSPRSREIIYSYARLRALRVEIDIRLATGDFSIEQAAEYLARAVPMDYETALEEAIFFSFNPGQAISYQVGKIQILRFLADAKLDQGDDFSLRHFHDFLMNNGNVPIALQRWEYLGRKDDVYRLDGLGGSTATVPQ